MKHQVIYLPVVAALILFASCKKDSGSNPSSGNTTRIKSISTQVTSPTIGNSNETINFNYDAQGRIVSLIDAANPGTKNIYTYASNNQFTVDGYYSNVLQNHFVLFLNSNLQQDSSYQYNNTKDTASDKFTYTYNSKNQIITSTDKEVSSDSAGYHSTYITTTQYTYDTSGNIVSTSDNFGNVTTYTYYPNLKYNAPLYTSPVKFFYGNYIKTETSNSFGSIATITYTYTFDSQNRLSTSNAVASDGSGSVLTTYTYY